MADKCLAKLSQSLLQLAILGVCMRGITYDSVNISVLIEQRNISFHNNISLKTMRLGILSWEKLKHRENHGRIVSLDQFRLGVEEQLLIFSASRLSPGLVKKLQKFINFCLKKIETFKVHMKTIVLWVLWNVQNQHIAERERCTTVVVLISGAFVWSRLIYQRCLHLSDRFTRNPQVNKLKSA